MGSAQALRNAVAVFAGQIEVKYQQVNRLARQALVQIIGTAEAGDRVPLLRQEIDKQFTQVFMILNNGNLEAGILGSNPHGSD